MSELSAAVNCNKRYTYATGGDQCRCLWEHLQLDEKDRKEKEQRQHVDQQNTGSGQHDVDFNIVSDDQVFSAKILFLIEKVLYW